MPLFLCVLKSVDIWYQGKNCHIGTYATQDEAAKANEAARKFLEESKGLSLSAKEIEANIKLAKAEAATEIDYRKVGVRQMESGNWVCPCINHSYFY